MNALVLLHQKVVVVRRGLFGLVQHGHRERASATVSRRRMVAIESGT